MNTYYWRAIRRIAKRKGIPISKARRLDWEKEANAERKRRSKASQRTPSRVHKAKTVPKKTIPTRAKGITDGSRKRTDVPRRVSAPKTKGKVPAPRVKPKLKIRDYGRMHIRDEEELDEEQEFIEEWESDWEQDYPELDDLDELEDFLVTFEHAEDDEYKEPS